MMGNNRRANNRKRKKTVLVLLPCSCSGCANALSVPTGRMVSDIEIDISMTLSTVMLFFSEGCHPVHCKRVVMDGLFTTEEIQQLQRLYSSQEMQGFKLVTSNSLSCVVCSIAEKGMALGGSAGGVSVSILNTVIARC